MIALPEWFPVKGQRLTSLMGLSLDGSRVDGAVLRRTNGSLVVQQTFSFSLSLDPLTADAELVGREVRNHLDAAGVKERHCVVGLPLKWALTTHVDLPEIPEEDLPGFLQIEAERSFPYDLATLFYATSRVQIPGGKEQALLAGIPRNHLQLLDQVLRAARLKPISFSLGILALQPPGEEKAPGALALSIGESHVGLAVVAGGGICALRALEGALLNETGQRKPNADLVARETRITLGQLPASLRETIREVHIFGPRDLAQHLADELELRLEAMGLKVEVRHVYALREMGPELPANTSITPATSLAGQWLAGKRPALELMPPRVTAWQQLSNRYASGKLRTVGVVVGVVLILVIGVFAFHEYQLSKVRSEWLKMSAQVKELEEVQKQIRQFRPWYDDTLKGMVILKQVTAAFPEDGVVTAKTIEIRDLSVVTCSGTARDMQSLLRTQERLRAAGGISDLKFNTIRGKSPMQFTFDFHWSEGGGR
jgi:hypothetical protein